MSSKFVESTHGKKHLCYLGYRYFAKHKNQNGSEYWICVKCNATATSYADFSVVVRGEHTHLPDETDKEVLEMRKNLKRKIIEESSPVDRIVEEAYRTIHAQPQSTDLIINLPAIRTMKNTLQKHRRKTRPSVPQKIEQLPFPLPDVYCKTAQGEWFLLYDGLLGGTRSLFFLPPITILFIYHSKNVGTVMGRFIHVRPFSIRYIRFMHIMTDYQHHAYSRYLVFISSFAALPLIPLNHMLQGLQCLICTQPEYPNIQGFLDYYHNTYGPFSKFPPHMYNHYRNITPRTINYLEGRHSRMKKH
ncbi:unnamed protein product, partial [Rotaria sp. Silwood2]